MFVSRYDHVKPKNNTSVSSVSTSKCGKKLGPPVLKESSSPSSGMVSLKKALKGEVETCSTPKSPEEWVQASEFIPGQPYKCSSSESLQHITFLSLGFSAPDFKELH